MIYQALTNSFRLELLSAVHNVGVDVIKMALYQTSAAISESTTAYSASGESVGSGYSAGGNTITATVTQLSDGGVLLDFADVTFAGVNITARGALVYNSSKSNKSILVVDFGIEISRSGSDMVVRFPTPDAENAIIRIL